MLPNASCDAHGPSPVGDGLERHARRNGPWPGPAWARDCLPGVWEADLAKDDVGSDGTGEVEREVERLGGDLLEGRVPSSDAPAPPPAQAAPLTGQSGAAAGHPARPPGRSPTRRPGRSPSWGPWTTSQHPFPSGSTPHRRPHRRTFPRPRMASWSSRGWTLRLSDLAGPLRTGSRFQVRHRYNEAIAAMGIVALAAFIGASWHSKGAVGRRGPPRTRQRWAGPRPIARRTIAGRPQRPSTRP